MFFDREISRWLGQRVRRPDGSTAEIFTKWAVMEVGVEKKLASHLSELLGKSDKRVLIVCDERTEKLSPPVERALRDNGFRTQIKKLPDPGEGLSPVADEELALEVERSLSEFSADCAVAIGSGTVNDLTKYASHLRKIPYSVYGTAASMNGYNSPIAALYVRGLKSSVPARPAVGIYADPEVIARAPRKLHLAGLGDLCSKPFAGADAAISAHIFQRQPWYLPLEIVSEAFDSVLERAEDIGRDQPEAVAMLMEALWISGFSMALAGTSAPASGGEHLWSHRIDMMRHDASLPPLALHGAQVGVGCIQIKPLFEQALRITPDEIEDLLQKPLQNPSEGEYAKLQEWIDLRHSDLKPRSRNSIFKQAEKKYSPDLRKKIRKGIGKNWKNIAAELKKAKNHAELVFQALKKANAPMEPEDLGLIREEAQRIITVCKDIRNRFTILDLTAELALPLVLE